MNNKMLSRVTLVIVSAILLLVSGCSAKDDNFDNTVYSSDNNLSDNISYEATKTAEQKVNVEAEYLKMVESFILSIKNVDAKAFKKIISPSGLIVIRNFSSGNGLRGKDIRNLYLVDEIQDNLQFEISNEVPIDLKEFFTKSQQTPTINLSVLHLNDIGFNFKHDLKSNIFEPSSDDIRDLCEILSNDYSNEDSPNIIRLGDNELVLGEFEAISDYPIGNWAVFEKTENAYYLRAIIDLR